MRLPHDALSCCKREDRSMPGREIGPAGFEPATSSTPRKRPTKLSYGPCSRCGKGELAITKRCGKEEREQRIDAIDQNKSPTSRGYS